TAHYPGRYNTKEEFGLDICEHFIKTFCHVVYCNAFIQEVPWQRLEKDNTPHAHAFLYSSEGIRFCEVERAQDKPPIVFSGIKNLKLMKTTQSGFQGFLKERYTTLPERIDRVLSVETLIKWCYGECLDGLDYDSIWRTAHESILDAFAGPPETGHYSPSYQKTVNCIQTYILERIPQASSFISFGPILFLMIPQWTKAKILLTLPVSGPNTL
uniref:Uricase n=1 Tax=Naja naja TaxID=35670 RepID=A0A8C6VGW9_NAJNA